MLSRLIDSLIATLFGTFQRVLFWELVRVFVLCLIGLSGVFTLLAVLQQLQFGASLSQVLRMLPLLVPISTPWIVPPACLFASCVVYGRLAHDNEAVALKAAGVDLYSVLRPAVMLGLLASACTAALQFSFTPYAWRTTKESLLNDPEEAICLALKKDRTIKFPGGKDRQYVLFVRDVDERRLSDVVLKVKTLVPGTAAGDVDVVARTREARLKVDLERKVIQLEGTWAWTGGSRSGDEPFETELPPQFNLTSLRAELKDNPVTLDWLELPQTAADRLKLAGPINRLRDALAALPADQSLTAGEQAALAAEVGMDPSKVPVDAAGRPAYLQHLREAGRLYERLDRILRYEYHIRPATAFGCLFFALLGCPAGLWASRSDYLSIFAILFLPALFVYYPILFMAGGYARDGKIPMALGVWTANGVLALVAVFLSWRLIRR